MASGRAEQQHDRKEAALIEWAESLRKREDDVVRRELKLETKARDLDELTVTAKSDQKALQQKLQRVLEEEKRLHKLAKELEDARVAVEQEQEQSLRRAHEVEDRMQNVFAQEVELNAYRHHLQRQADKLEARNRKIKARRAQLKDAAEFVSLQQARLDQGELRIQQIHDDTEALLHSKVETEAQLRHATEELKATEERLKVARTELEETNAAYEDSKRQTLERSQELQAVQAQLLALQTSVVSTSHKLQKLSQQHHQVEIDIANSNTQLKGVRDELVARNKELEHAARECEERAEARKQLEAAIVKLDEQKASTLAEIESRLELLRTQASLFRQSGGRLFPELSLDSEMSPNASLRLDTSLKASHVSMAGVRQRKLDVRQLLHLKRSCISMRKDCARMRELQEELRHSAEMLFETKVASKLDRLKATRNRELEELKSETRYLRQMKHEADVALRHTESDLAIANNKIADLEEALQTARSTHDAEYSELRTQLSIQHDELQKLRARNTKLTLNLQGCLRRVSDVISMLSNASPHQTHDRQLDHTNVEDLFSRLTDCLEKLNGLANRQETYVQYLNQEQASLEQQVTRLKAEVANATQQLQTTQQERDDTEQVLAELDESVKDKQQQLQRSEQHIHTSLQLSHQRLLDLSSVLEQRQQEAAALASLAEEKFALLRAEQTNCEARTNLFLQELNSLGSDVERKLGTRRNKYLKKLVKAHKKLRVSATALLTALQHQAQRLEAEQQVSEVADDIAVKRTAVGETLKVAESAAAEIIGDAREQAEEIVRQARHTARQELAERQHKLQQLDVAIERVANENQQQMVMFKQNHDTLVTVPSRTSMASRDMDLQPVAVAKHQDMMRLQLAHLKQCRRLIAAQVLRNYCVTKEHMNLAAAWWKWRSHAVSMLRAELDARDKLLTQNTAQLVIEQNALDKKSNEVKQMLERCQEAVALSRQQETDAAKFAKIQEEHNRQTIQDLTDQNSQLLARNNECRHQISKLQESLAQLQAAANVETTSAGVQCSQSRFVEIPVALLSRHLLLPSLLAECRAFLENGHLRSDVLVVELRDLEQTNENNRVFVQESLAWFLGRLQQVELSVTDSSAQTDQEQQRHETLLRQLHSSFRKLRTDHELLIKLARQYRDASPDADNQRLTELLAHLGKLATSGVRQQEQQQAEGVALSSSAPAAYLDDYNGSGFDLEESTPDVSSSVASEEEFDKNSGEI